MLHFLISHIIAIIGFTVLCYIIRSEARSYMASRGIDRTEFISLLRKRKDELGLYLLQKASTTIVLTLIISAVSFRKLWIPDVFHVVFLSLLMVNMVELKFKQLFK